MAYLDRDGGRIYYEDHAGPGRPILLIHSWAMNVRVWDSTLSLLKARGHRVMTFDQRGCGQSDKDFADFSIGASAGDAVALVHHLGLDGVIVDGWSLGGAIATETAHRLGRRCAALIHTCAASPRYTRTDDFPHGGTVDDLNATLTAISPDRATFFHGISQVVCAKPVGQPVIDWMWSIFLQASPGVDESMACLADIDQRGILAALEVPLLAMAGTGDVFAPPGIAEAAVAMAKDGALILFEGCGHAPFIEDYQGYVDALTRFLDRIG